MGPGPARQLAWAYLALAAVFAGTVSALALRDALASAFQDDWPILDDFYSQPLLEWLFSDRNGHRLPATLFLLFLDFELWDGRMRLLVLASLACAWASAACLGAGLGGRRALADPLARALLAFGGFALFWAGGRHDFLWGINHCIQLAALGVLLSLACLVAASPRRDGRRLTLASAAAGCLATFAHGAGVAGFAGLLAVALAGRRPRRAAGLAAAGLLSAALYGLGQRPPPSQRVASWGELVWSDPLGVLAFAASFLGADVGWWVRGLGLAGPGAVAPISAAAGALGALALALLAARLAARPECAGRRELLGLGLMAFGAAAAVLVALNRLPRFPAQATALRFTTWSTLFWVGFAFALPSLPGRGEGRGARVGLAVALLAGVSLSLLPALGAARALHAERRERVEISALLHLLGIRSDAFAGGAAVLRSPEQVYRVVDRLRRERRNLFADARAGLPGERLAEHFAAASAARCSGFAAAPEPLPARGRAAASFKGWVRDLESGRRPELVVLVDSAERIRGLARVADEPLAEGHWPWLGFVADFDAAEPYTAHAITADRRACRLRADAG